MAPKVVAGEGEEVYPPHPHLLTELSLYSGRLIRLCGHHRRQRFGRGRWARQHHARRGLRCLRSQACDEKLQETPSDEHEGHEGQVAGHARNRVTSHSFLLLRLITCGFGQRWYSPEGRDRCKKVSCLRVKRKTENIAGSN